MGTIVLDEFGYLCNRNMKRYFLQIAYNGKAYHGWQIQPDANTVQEVLNDRLSKILGHADLTTTGCGRTDTGVHASAYWLHFDCNEPLAFDFVHRLNSFLPGDIAAYRCEEVQPDQHARFDAVLREYSYFIHTRKDPFLIDKSWLCMYALNVDKMNIGASMLLGERDFSCFARSGAENKSSMCNVSHAAWEQSGDRLVFTIRANRFLRNMVRAIVGTLIDLGRGYIDLNYFQRILLEGTRSDAGRSAPACGLFLSDVKYPFLSEWPLQKT